MYARRERERETETRRRRKSRDGGSTCNRPVAAVSCKYLPSNQCHLYTRALFRSLGRRLSPSLSFSLFVFVYAGRRRYLDLNFRVLAGVVDVVKKGHFFGRADNVGEKEKRACHVCANGRRMLEHDILDMSPCHFTCFFKRLCPMFVLLSEFSLTISRLCRRASMCCWSAGLCWESLPFNERIEIKINFYRRKN